MQTFEDVLVGEVWVCSGQSNMEWSILQSKDAQLEIETAEDPLLRHIKVNRATATEGQFTFEGDGPKAGAPAIMEKLRTLPPVQHQPQTIETQPSTNPNAILVFCTGNILVEQGKPLKYSEVFQLVASAPGQYYLHNVIFRFNYA